MDAGGNFFVTAENPRGPWSDPVWLKEIDGIDPSFFFDEDGKAYILNNGPPEGTPLYDGHRAIWIQEFDRKAGKLIGPRKVIVNGGVDLSKKPIWIEGPHLYRIKGWYYLMCAEGGTERGHSEVIFRGKSPVGSVRALQGQSHSHATRFAGGPRQCGDQRRPRRSRADGGRQLVGRVPGLAPLRGLSLQHRPRNLPAAGELEETAGR